MIAGTERGGTGFHCIPHSYLLLIESVLAVVRAHIDLTCPIDAYKEALQGESEVISKALSSHSLFSRAAQVSPASPAHLRRPMPCERQVYIDEEVNRVVHNA